ncbi:MAG: hypothetical protein U9Q33_07350 [Campylobacterota bacterium]|nr:hypothetical protein [Campylobacterota bacterium]
MKKSEHLLQINKQIENLQVEDIYDNLFFYKYHSRYLKKLQKTDIDKDDPHYISTYSSLVGELYENVVYELLLPYAIENQHITRFVLKGPHQDNYKNYKNGLMIDINSQIVYKAGYKDVTEFDALFFTKESVYFVETTIVKTTTSLRKRLKKKKALLEVLFPKLKIKALIILTKGAMGVSVFPSYCTVWLTKPLEDKELIKDIVYNLTKKDKKFIEYGDKKLIHTYNVYTKDFKYFDTLSWILRSVRKDQEHIVDFKFLSTPQIERYFEIFSKFYIGYMDTHSFIEVLKFLNITNISEDIPMEKIFEDQVVVTIEKTKETFTLVYYLKITGDKLKRLDIADDSLKVSDKDPKGFTAAEIKYMKYLFKKGFKLSLDDIKTIESKIEDLDK